MKLLKLSLVLLVTSAAVFTTAYADKPNNCLDQISMQLQEEGWVTSATSQVTVNIQAATSKDNSAILLASITNKLKGVVKGSVEWRLVNLSTEKNSAGLLAISVAMTARLTSDQLAQLQNSIETLNKAGEQYKIDDIDYQPQLSEISAESSRLRALLYKDVLEQQKIINNAFGGVNYQLQTLNFVSDANSSPVRPMMLATMGSNARQASPSAAPFSQQMILSANVTFSTHNFACEKVAK